MQLVCGPWPRPPVALFRSRFEAGEHMLFFHSDRRKHGLVDPTVIALSDGGVAFGYPWAYLEGRELRRVELDGLSLLDACPEIEDRHVLLVDDGASDPETIGAAAAWIRRGGARRLVVAVAAADRRLYEAVGDRAALVLVGQQVHHLTPGTNVFAEPPTSPREAQAWLDDVNRREPPEPPPRRPRRLHRNGFRWTIEDELTLLDAFDLGTPVQELAGLLGRTVGAVRSRLEMYGLVEREGSTSDARFLSHLRAGKVLARAWTRRNQVRALRHLLRRETPDEALETIRELEQGLRPEPGDEEASYAAIPDELVGTVHEAMVEEVGETLQVFLDDHPELGVCS